MADKFYGRIGFGQTVEVRPGVREDVITERKLYGDVLRPGRSYEEGTKVNKDISLSNRISVVIDDPWISENSYAIRFVEWKGVLWTVKKIDEARPRLILSLGEVYNGPVASTPESGDI